MNELAAALGERVFKDFGACLVNLPNGKKASDSALLMRGRIEALRKKSRDV